MNASRRFWMAATTAQLLGAAGLARAQAAARQGRIIVPYAPGGAADTLARALAQRLEEPMGSRVVVDNRPGGGTVIGTQAAAAAPADGQTLLVVAASFVIQPLLLAKPPYDPLRDFSAITLAATNPHVLVVHPSVPAETLAQFVDWAKAQRGMAAYASFGNGSSGHLSFEMLKKEAGFDMVHVPYKGGAPAMQDLLAGQVSAMLTDLLPALPFIKSGKFRAIAVGSAHRDAALPSTPTFTEAGLRGFESQSWFGLMVRSEVRPETVQGLGSAVNAALRDPAMQAPLEAAGLQLVGGSPAQFRDFLARETSRYREAIRVAKLQPI